MCCSFDGCKLPVKSKNLCNGHYEQVRLSRLKKPLLIKNKGLACHCGAPSKVKGLCQKHYDLGRPTRHGTPEQQKERALKFQFGISLEKYKTMFESQGGLCAICKKPESALNQKRTNTKLLAVDHDHKTGLIRGLLCGRCNTAIGLLQEDPSLLDAAKKYINVTKEN